MLYYPVSRKKKEIQSSITLTEKLNSQKLHFKTGSYARLMTEAPTIMFGFIIFILRSNVLEKIQTVSHVG